MRKLVRVAALAVIAVGMSAVFPAGALPPGVRDTYNKPAARQYAPNCGEGAENQLYFDGPAKLWPPNHKYYGGGISVTATDSDGDNISLTSSGTHNQYEGDTEWNGSGNTADDIRLADGQTNTGTAKVPATTKSGDPVSVTWIVRSERSGHKDPAVPGEGRVYTITGHAVYNDGECRGEWKITVPHDMSPKNR